MAQESNVLIEMIFEQARQLPPESLSDLAKYVEFLTYKTSGDWVEDHPISVAQITKLDGILEGFDFSPEVLAEARRELWSGFGDIDL